MYFPVNFGKFLRTSFLQNTSGRLLVHSFLKLYSGTLHNQPIVVGKSFNKFGY